MKKLIPLLLLLTLVLAILACRKATPCDDNPALCDPTATVITATVTVALPSPTYLPTIPVTIWTPTPAPSGSGKAQP